MRSANPTLSDAIFQKAHTAGHETDHMTINGTVMKTLLLLIIMLVPATYVWSQFYAGAEVGLYIWVGLIGGLVVGIVTAFKTEWSPVTGPLYAALEGLFVGGVSAMFESLYPGIVIQAVGLTFGTLFCLLLIYRSGVIKVTENFKMGIVAATGAIALIYIVTIVLRLLGGDIPLIHENGIIGIGFSLFVVTIAALNLVLDFDFIENASKPGTPKYMEWYGAFGLMVTLIWLYIEFLRLLAKLRSR